MSEPTIIHIMDHYEAYLNGKFICSGDTHNEAETEADKITTEGGSEINVR